MICVHGRGRSSHKTPDGIMARQFFGTAGVTDDCTLLSSRRLVTGSVLAAEQLLHNILFWLLFDARVSHCGSRRRVGFNASGACRWLASFLRQTNETTYCCSRVRWLQRCIEEKCLPNEGEPRRVPTVDLCRFHLLSWLMLAGITEQTALAKFDRRQMRAHVVKTGVFRIARHDPLGRTDTCSHSCAGPATVSTRVRARLYQHTHTHTHTHTETHTRAHAYAPARLHLCASFTGQSANLERL